MTACKGSVIGLIDKILFDSYSSTCICKTVQATAFEIDVVEFFKRIDLSSSSMQEFKSNMIRREDMFEKNII